jgi:DNA-binding IclR family transcriptional regulator
MADDPIKSTGRGRHYPAPALEKGLEIIELLAAAGEPLSTRAIADKLGRSKGEIFRMLCVLMDRGYLDRDPVSEELALSHRLFDLGIRTPRARPLMEIAVPAMEQLSEVIAQSVHLVVLSEGQTVVVANAPGPGDISLTLKLGYRRPAFDATSGKVMLAFQAPQTRQRSFDLAGIATEREQARMSSRLDEIESRGYLIADSHDVPGVTDISAPILDRRHRCVASLVVPYLNRLTEKPRHADALAKLLATCGAISAELV